MRWRKLGRVFCPEGNAPWMVSHASNPVAEPLDGSGCRIYFSTRDERNQSSIAWVEVDLRAPERVVRIAERPILSPGRIGTFDDSGVSMGCLVCAGADRYLYYIGWNLGVTVPWRNSIGLAISRNGAPFERVSEAPVLDRGHHDPFSLSYPWVLREEAAWRMWYGSNTTWGGDKRDMNHVIKYAESQDGRAWSRDGRVAIALAQGEHAISRPCVTREAGRYRMWYSFRGLQYRIGYAEADDAISWARCDEKAGIVPSTEGWDSEAVCYPSVFDHSGMRYMLFNGNGYGRTGFGIAILERE